jgi:hypothetical protein
LRGKILEAPNQDKKDPSENEFKKEKVTRHHFLKLVGAAGTLATLATVMPFGKIFANSNNVTNTTYTEGINQPIK